MVEEELIGEVKDRHEANNEESQHRALGPEVLAGESVWLEITVFAFVVS